MQIATPVLLLTQDDFLWEHWRCLDRQQWLLARGNDLVDLHRWRQQERTILVIDSNLPELPEWRSSVWQTLTHGRQVVIVSARPSDEEGSQAMASGATGYCHAYVNRPGFRGGCLVRVNQPV